MSVSQQGQAFVMAERIGSLDELVADPMVGVLAGFERLLGAHQAFALFLAERAES